MRQVEISKREAGQRLDKYLQKLLARAPKNFLYKMLRKKNITLNGKKAAGSEKLETGDQICLFLSAETLEKFSLPAKEEDRLRPEKTFKLQPEIVYEDSQVLLLNKPVGLLSQKSRPEDQSLTEWVQRYLYEDSGGAAGFSPGICNRLDRNTSGIVAAGKSVRAQQELSEMFKARRMGKYYLCPVRGVLTEEGRLRGHLQKSGKENKVRIDAAGAGDRVETAYRPLGDNGVLTLLEVELITGKSHQIRAHLAGIGHPVVGDGKYGGAQWRRACQERYGCGSQLLHAWRLVFPPACEGVLSGLSGQVFSAGLPVHFERFLQKEHLEGFIPWKKKKNGKRPS